MILIIIIIGLLLVTSEAARLLPREAGISEDAVLTFGRSYPPKLHPSGDEHQVNSGQSWELRCTGHFPIVWEYPASTTKAENGGGPGIDSRVEITHETQSGENPRPFVSYLRLKNSHYLDTGRFYCMYEDTNDLNAHQNVTSTYLYVYDNDHLIDYPMERTYVNVHQNQEAIIPCRPTNSDVKMTFFRGKTEDISNVLESNLMRYEATTGLTVLSGAMQFHSSQITCRAQLGSKIQDYHFILEFHEDFGHILPTPNIFPSTPLHLVVGEKLKLVCQIDFYDENPDVDLIWDLEGKRQRADIGNLQRRIDPMQRGHLIVSKALTVDPIQETDEGGYTCYTVSNSDSASKGNETVYTIKHIRKHDREAHISNVVFQGHPEIVRDSKRPRNLGFPIKWIFDVFATPDPQYLWIGPNGHEISHDTLEKYEFDVDETNHRIKLIINDLQLSDMGHYVFTIEVDNDAQDARPLVKDIDMYLKVAADPVVTLTAEFEKKLYLYQHSYEYTCRVEGYPIDEQSLQWTFHPCLDYGACNETVNVSPDLYSKLKPIDDLQNTNDHYNFSSILIVSAETSGIYRCKVCSEAATSSSICSQDETRVLISDYSQDGFTIVGPEVPNDIIEGDIVELTCAASIYTYDQVVWFKEKPKKLATDDKWEKLPPGITMDNRRSNFSVKENPKKLATEDKWKGLDLYPGIKMDRITKFSVISTITYPNVIIAEGGNFQCRAVLKNDTMDVVVDKEIEVVVLTPIKPSWSKTFGMNGTTISREQGHDREILDCSAHGRPPPVITWTKDGKSFPNVDTENTSSIQMAKDNSSIIFQVALPIHSGKYECSASNRAGTITGKAKFEVIEPIVFPGWVIALIVIGCTVIIILGIVLAWRVRVYNEKYKQLTAQELNMFENGDPGSINPELGVDDQADLLPYNKSYEFPRESLKLGKQLGSGAFGRVLKAQAIGINAWERSSTVAVKMVKPNADVMYVRALMSELKIMIHLGRHMNIVNLLGASTKCLARKELFVIVEYCRFGNLQKYLLQHRYHFISQVDPITGNIDFNIGQDAIDGYGNDFARAREEEEMSAAYLRPNNTNQDGYLMPNESVEQQQQKPTRNKSVRYVANPGDKRQRTISIQSDCNRIVSTDMTTLPEEEEESDSTNNEINPAGTRPGVERSQSTKSEGGPGPGWRANMKGDYDVTTVKPISTKDLLCWAYQVTRGMEYLSSKKVMHGDLACRNILLAADNVVKICDFGLAKDIYKNNSYQKKTDGPLPVKWMAIESIRDRIFSTQSDVWSFGIVLWEMFSMGKTPYPGIEACDLYAKLVNEHRMENPEICPQSIYEMMLHTWDTEPTNRPTFLELMDELGDLLEEGETDHYLDLSKRFDASTAGTNNAVENKDYLAMMSPPDFNTQMSVSPSHHDQDQGAYLAPIKTLIKIDSEDYLVPSQNQQKPDQFEMLPLLQNGNNGNHVQTSS